MTKIDFNDLKTSNASRWKIGEIRDNKVRSADQIAHRLCAPKERYQHISALTSVPWPIIALIHEREADQSFLANLAQGDRWDRVSTHVPRGEGPFDSFEDAAVHALINDDHLNIWGDWSIGGALTALEKFNGLGYYTRHLPSAYVWSWTPAYSEGKFTSDGHFDPDAVDVQPGCAALLMRMIVIDPTISIDYGWKRPAGVSSPLAPEHDTQWVQATLNTLGAEPKLEVDGRFGARTKAALREWQQHVGILDDGKFGPVTSAKMTEMLKKLVLKDTA